MDKKHVLIVDDSPGDISIVMENLKGDYAILVAKSGQKALEIASSQPKPDVILMDVMMPELNGYETCKELKSHPVTKDIDVIFISAHDTLEEKLAGYDAGGSDYLIKPVQVDELKRKVSVSIENSNLRLQEESARQEAVKTAMTAMSSAGEQGIVLDFLRNSAVASTLTDLAQMISDSIARYQVMNTVVLHSSTQTVSVGTTSPVPPLETELLLRHNNDERIREFESRAIFKFGAVSILAKNMPTDEERRGRLRDHLAIIAESADTKVRSITVDEQLSKLTIDANKMLDKINLRQEANRKEGQRILGQVLAELRDAFNIWEITESQEERLINLVSNAMEASQIHLEKGHEIDKDMREIINRLEAVSFALVSK